MRSFLYALALGAAALLACGETGDAPSGSPRPDASVTAPTLAVDAGADCAIFVADPLIDHSCFHALMGPFRDRDLSAPGAELQEVNRAHTAFQLKLAAEGEHFVGTVRYDVRAAGGHAFFASASVSLVLHQGDSSAAVAAFATHDTELCPELPLVGAYSLSATSYTVQIDSNRPDVTLVIEYMDEGALDGSYRVECADPRQLDGGVQPDSQDANANDAGSGPDAALVDSTTVAPHDPGTADAGAGECRVDPVLEHSCLHVQHGPFATVTAMNRGTLPNVNTPHTAFTVLLSEQPSNRVSYRPNQSGEHVLYVGADVRVAVSDDSAVIPPKFSETVAACAGLATAAVVELKGQAKYTLLFERVSSTASTQLVIEPVGALAPRGWAERWEACE